MERKLKKIEDEEGLYLIYSDDNDKKKLDHLRVIVLKQDPGYKLDR